MGTTCFESGRVKLDEGYIYDATQYNSKGQIIWAESEDLQVSAFADILIHTLDVNKNAWSQIYCMVTDLLYGQNSPDHVDNFTIKMVYPCTVEDSERDELFDNDMNMIDTFLDLTGNEEMFEDKTRKDVLLHFISNFLNEPEIAEMLEDDETTNEPKQNNDFDSDSDFSDEFYIDGEGYEWI